jgi:hypothetical protein
MREKALKPFYFLLILALVLAGCTTDPAPNTQVASAVTDIPIPPTSAAYPSPDLAVDEEAMITEIAKLGGCAAEGSGFTCPPGSKLNAIGCEVLYKSIRYPGLKPYPVFQCENHNNIPGFNPDWSSEEPNFVGSFTYDGSQFLLIKPDTDIQSLFAPLGSANEALSYAILFLSHSWPDWFIHAFEEYDIEYSGDRCGIENGSVKETQDGYVVHSSFKTYADIDSGCFTRIYAIDILVTPSGEMSAIEPGPQLLSSQDDCPGPDEDPCR